MFDLYLGSMNCLSNQAKYIVAYMQAQGVPMAVPISWSHHVSPNLNMFVRMTSVSKCMVKSTEIMSGFSLRYVTRYFLMVGSPSFGLILVYIEVASAVNNFAEGGRLGTVFKLLRSSKEFFMYAGICRVNG